MSIVITGKPVTEPKHGKTNKMMCLQRRLRSSWASAQSDQSLRCALYGYLRTQGFFMWSAKTLNSVGGWPGWSETSLGAHVIVLVLSCGCSFAVLCEWLIKNNVDHLFNAGTVLMALKAETLLYPSSLWYRKFPKYSDTQKICCNHSKIWTVWLYHRVMSTNDADRMANSVDPDQTAPLGAVWSGSALFAQAYLSENVGSLP